MSQPEGKGGRGWNDYTDAVGSFGIRFGDRTRGGGARNMVSAKEARADL